MITMEHQFSVLICTFNRHELLNRALQALLNTTDEKPNQVVIVNGGDQNADHVVSKHQAYCSNWTELKLIKTINKNLAASRNVGLPHCTGDIVAMTDDDAEVFPDWVTQHKRIHTEHPEAGAVGGMIIGASSDRDFLSRLADQVTFPQPAEAKYVRTLPGVNVSYKRAAIDAVGLQDETLFRGEDVDFNWRIQKAGHKVYFHPDIKVIHHHRPTLRKMLEQHYMYGRAYYLVRKKWTDMYCIYPHKLSTLKDVLKGINFVATIVYEPLIYGLRMRQWSDRVRAIPAILANQIAWKSGMIRQKWIETRRKH